MFRLREYLLDTSFADFISYIQVALMHLVPTLAKTKFGLQQADFEFHTRSRREDAWCGIVVRIFTLCIPLFK